MAEEESEHTSGEFPVAHTAETVMVVEDEDMVRSLVVRILRRAGYEVISAANGEEALSLSASHGDPISLVLTDVVMPKMGGQKLIRLDLDGRKVAGEETLIRGMGRLRDVQQGPDGSIYVAVDGDARGFDGAPTPIVRLVPHRRIDD